MWLGTEALFTEVKVTLMGESGKEFTYMKPESQPVDVLKFAVGTITKVWPTARQRRDPLRHPDTLHFTPDPVVVTAEDGTTYEQPQPTMVIPRDRLDDYIITPYQKHPTAYLAEAS